MTKKLFAGRIDNRNKPSNAAVWGRSNAWLVSIVNTTFFPPHINLGTILELLPDNDLKLIALATALGVLIN